MEAAHLEAGARSVLAAAREAQAQWAALDVATRASRLQAAGRLLLEGAEELAALIQAETHKPLGESFSGDVLGVADLFEYWCAKGPAMLRPRRGAIPWLDMPGKSATIERDPRGVVAVISPWNYPVALPMRVIVPALLAGNAVVLKPSEFTPRSGVWIIERLASQLGAVVSVIEGAGDAGRALIAAGPDLVHFTGSTHTGRKVAVQCAELGIPCETELGGKDCAVVLDDCAIERTAAGVAWGVVHNAGQDCASVERVVVHSRVADTFLPRLVAAMNAAASQVPGLVTPRQREIVIAQLEDARDRGAKFLCGGLPVDDGPIQPTLITGLSRDALAWREESFGPIAVVEVHDTDEALLAAANDTSFGLGGSVWGQDLRRAEALGRRLRTGMVWVNNHAFTGALPDLPWVGRGASGLGITSSPETMEHLTRPRLVVIDKSAALEPWWYPYGETLVDLMRVLIERKRVGGIGVTIRTLQTLGRRNKVVASAGK